MEREEGGKDGGGGGVVGGEECGVGRGIGDGVEVGEVVVVVVCVIFFFNDTATTEIYTLSLHDALPICGTFDHHNDKSEPLIAS